MSIFTPQVSTPILIVGSEKIILHFTTLSVKIHFKIQLGIVSIQNREKIVRARPSATLFFGEVLPVIMIRKMLVLVCLLQLLRFADFFYFILHWLSKEGAGFSRPSYNH